MAELLTAFIKAPLISQVLTIILCLIFVVHSLLNLCTTHKKSHLCGFFYESRDRYLLNITDDL
ncbi:hypothetical protein RHO67_25850, partial [Salmonella enterica subsp. enterica serovar Typhimurium]|nr:hypothetical protein [Salmonella enterica subsp. enterica serovar Typhimurium]